MFMKTFLIMLKNILKKDHPDLELDFYLSRRSKFVHMDMDTSITKYKRYEQLIRDIEAYWKSKKNDDRFKFIEPKLINSVKWKFDYVIFEKNYDC